MSNRVFSYSNWNMFCGFDPMYTESDRIKLQAIDGTNVKAVGDQYLLTQNPLGGIGFIPVCATRQFNKSDISFEQLLNDSEMIAEVYRNMVAQAALIPSEFYTLAYLDDIKHETGAFALVSVCKYDVESSIIYYKVHQVLPVASVNKYVRAEMLMRKLPSMGRFIPSGFSVDDPDVAVFSMSPDMAINCMIDVNPNMHFGLTSENKEIIDQYIQNTVDYIDSDDADDLTDAYFEVCRSALNACSQPDLVETELRKKYTGRRIIRKQDTITRAKQYMFLEKQYLAAVDEIQYLKQTNKKQADAIKSLEVQIAEALMQAKNNSDNEELFCRISAEYFKKYSYLEKSALESLINAEFLYRVHEDHEFIDFAPVIVEFSKALEIQLLKHLNDRKPEAVRNKMTLGEIVKAIDDYKIAPYHRSKDKYRFISKIRGESAHVDPKTKEDVDLIRNAFYSDGILKGLK